MRGSPSRNRRRRETGESLVFPAGAKVFDADRPSRCIYRVRSGRVYLSAGGDAITDFLGPGNFFGEKLLLGRPGARQSATCLSKVEVTAIRRPELLHRLQHDRRFAIRFLRDLSLRLDRYEQTIRGFVVDRAEYRLAWALSRFVPDRAPSGWVRLDVSPNNSDLAKVVGTTRWRISHFIGHFQELGWLRRLPELWVNREGLAGFLGKSRAAMRVTSPGASPSPP